MAGRDLGEAPGAMEGQRTDGEGVRSRPGHQRRVAVVVEVAVVVRRGEAEGSDPPTAPAAPDSDGRDATDVRLRRGAAAVAPEPLEVVLPSSIRIRVPAGFDPRSLGRLLEVLDARR